MLRLRLIAFLCIVMAHFSVFCRPTAGLAPQDDDAVVPATGYNYQTEEQTIEVGNDARMGIASLAMWQLYHDFEVAKHDPTREPGQPFTFIVNQNSLLSTVFVGASQEVVELLEVSMATLLCTEVFQDEGTMVYTYMLFEADLDTEFEGPAYYHTLQIQQRYYELQN